MNDARTIYLTLGFAAEPIGGCAIPRDHPARRVDRPVHTVGIVAALATILGIEYPKGIDGVPLIEALARRGESPGVGTE